MRILVPLLMVVQSAVPSPVLAQPEPGGEVWQQQETLVASDGAAGEFAQFGVAVAVDGDTAAVGARGTEVGGTQFVGSAYVYLRTGERWHEQAALRPPGGDRGDEFGQSVAVDGDTVLVGAPRHGDSGSVYVYTRNGQEWTLQATLTSPDPAPEQAFGSALAVDGDTALVGAAFGGGDQQGAVHVLTRDPAAPGTWTERATLTAADGARLDHFGEALALAGDTAVVGAQRATVDGTDGQGAAYVFTGAADSWQEQAKLAAAEGTAHADFGRSVALHGDTVLVGAVTTTIGESLAQGAAYVFTRQPDGQWQERAMLTASDGQVFDRFGAGVALHGDTALVGAVGASTAGNGEHGATYVYSREPGSGAWQEQAKLIGEAARPMDVAGVAVAMTADTAVVGALGFAQSRGRAYVYALAPEVRAPALDLAPARITAALGPDETTGYEVVVGNSGDADLQWGLFEGDATPAGLSHSASDAIEPSNALACRSAGTLSTLDNRYLRAFSLEDFLVFGDFQVTGVTFGVEELRGAPVTATVNLYTLDGDAEPLIYENLSPIGSADITLDPQRLTTVTVPVTGAVPAGATLVVEVDIPAVPATDAFLIGTNARGQTGPSYWHSDACGRANPVDPDELGYPGMHVVMEVAGAAEPTVCDVPAGGPWAAVDPVAGAVAPGAEQPVTVTLDSSGLPAGTHGSLLCLQTDDPGRSVAAVPVTVEVAGSPATCDDTITGRHPGPLTVTAGVTCLAAGAWVLGEVAVLPGAGLRATAAVVQGPLSAVGASTIDLTASQVTGPVTIRGTSGGVALFGNQVTGSVLLLDNHTHDAAMVAANTITGSLACTGNQPPPVDGGAPNTVVGGGRLGQCADL